MIFLSEIDPKSQATKDFKKKINKGYEVLLPYGNDLKKNSRVFIYCVLAKKRSRLYKRK